VNTSFSDFPSRAAAAFASRSRLSGSSIVVFTRTSYHIYGSGWVSAPRVSTLGALVAMTLLFWLMARFGLCAVVVTTFVLGTGSLAIPATLQFGQWYGQAALTWTQVMAAPAAFGAYTSPGGRPLKRTFD